MWFKDKWLGFLAMLVSLFGKQSSEKIHGSLNGKPVQLFENIALKNISLFKGLLCIGRWRLEKSTIAIDFIGLDYIGKIVLDNNTNIFIDNLDENDDGIYSIGYNKWKKYTEIKSGNGRQILFSKFALEEVSLYKNTSLVAIWNLFIQEPTWINASYARRVFLDSKNSIIMADIGIPDAGKYIIKYGILDNSTGPEVELIVLEELSEEEQVHMFLDDHPEFVQKYLGEPLERHQTISDQGSQMILLMTILVVVLLPKCAWSFLKYILFLCMNKIKICNMFRQKRKDEAMKFKADTSSGDGSILSKSNNSENEELINVT